MHWLDKSGMQVQFFVVPMRRKPLAITRQGLPMCCQRLERLDLPLP